MKTNIRILSFTLAALVLQLFVSNLKAQQEKFYAAFVYQFTKFINWPNPSSAFTVAVIGNSPVTDYLMEITKDKQVGSSPIKVVHLSSSGGEISSYNVLFISDNQSANLSSIVSKIGRSSTLIITESSGAISNGADISFLLKDGKIRFELNKTGIRKKGLSVSSDLERLASNVY